MSVDVTVVIPVFNPGRSIDPCVNGMLAQTIAAFPQQTMLGDRRAAIEGAGLPLAEGLELERRLGIQALELAARGAARFAAGEGRHGEGL